MYGCAIWALWNEQTNKELSSPLEGATNLVNLGEKGKLDTKFGLNEFTLAKCLISLEDSNYFEDYMDFKLNKLSNYWKERHPMVMKPKFRRSFYIYNVLCRLITKNWFMSYFHQRLYTKLYYSKIMYSLPIWFITMKNGFNMNWVYSHRLE